MKSFRIQLNFLIPLGLVLIACAYISTLLIDELMQSWFLRDIDIRSRFAAATVRLAISNTPTPFAPNELREEFDLINKDERLYAIGFCDKTNTMRSRSTGYPEEIDCAKAIETAASKSNILLLPPRHLHIATRTLTAPEVKDATIVVIHNVDYMRQRIAEARHYFVWLFIVLGTAIALTTAFIAHRSWRRWIAGTKTLLRNLSAPEPPPLPPELHAIAAELRGLLRDQDDECRSRKNTEDWTPERLRQILSTEMHGEQVIVISNREPYIHSHGHDGIHIRRPASGLVVAIEPVMRACSGTWIAHGSGNADRETVDKHDHIAVPPEDPNYTLRRIWMSKEEEQGFYYGFANEGLWPLCHLAHVRPVFRLSDWEHYKTINQRFTDAIVAEAQSDDPIVLIQDYHFALVPTLLRKRLPNATIIMFWHIPWPNPESFGVCPWHEELLKGMLGSSILGFHTRYHCRNFLESVDRFLEARIRQEESTVSFNGVLTQINSYPCSIHWPTTSEVERWPSISDCRHALRKMIGVPQDHLVAIGVDRLDYTKGIVERLHAVDRMLDKYPALRHRFTFVQFAAPSRETLDEYQFFSQQVQTLIKRINHLHGTPTWQPIVLIAEHQESEFVTQHYRGADCCVVTSVHDGMNLVAKEFVSARDDNQGVLLLSQFTGAARELSSALIVNPYDIERTADALYQGLNMSKEEQAERMREMRNVVREDNTYRWAANMLLDANRLRRTERITARIVSSKQH